MELSLNNSFKNGAIYISNKQQAIKLSFFTIYKRRKSLLWKPSSFHSSMVVFE